MAGTQVQRAFTTPAYMYHADLEMSERAKIISDFHQEGNFNNIVAVDLLNEGIFDIGVVVSNELFRFGGRKELWRTEFWG